MESFWLACFRCGSTQPFDLKGKCECGGALLVEYDMERIRQSWKRALLPNRPWDMWRYRELLPVRNYDRIVSLGEGGTPLLRIHGAEQRFPFKALYSKREETNPTGSFKARGFSSAITLLNERGARKVAVNSNGNAASAMAAYAARAGMEAYVFVPKDCPGLIVEESIHYGAHTFLVDGYIQDAGRIVEAGASEYGWFNVGTMREPGRAEGKKTMGFEVAEQLGWTFPDVILYPTGGGSGIVGLWRAFKQLQELGWVQGDLPRLIAVQECGCQPVVDLVSGSGKVAAAIGCVDKRGDGGSAAAEAAGSSARVRVASSPTGLRVPCPPDGPLIASILQLTGGTAVAVTREEIDHAARELSAMGLSASPEGAASWAGLIRLHEDGYFAGNGRNETVVLFNTSHAAKYWPWQRTAPIPVLQNYDDFKAVHPPAKER